MTFRIIPKQFMLPHEKMSTMLQEIETITIDTPSIAPLEEIPKVEVDDSADAKSGGDEEMDVEISYDGDNVADGLMETEPLAIDTSNVESLMMPSSLGKDKKFQCKVGEVDKGTYNTVTTRQCEEECKATWPTDTGHTCEVYHEPTDFKNIEIDTKFDLSEFAPMDKIPETTMRCINNTCVSREIKFLDFAPNSTACSERSDDTTCLSDEKCVWVFPNKVHDSICIPMRNVFEYDFYPKYAYRIYAQMTTFGPNFINNCYTDHDCRKFDSNKNETKKSEIDLCHKLDNCSEFDKQSTEVRDCRNLLKRINVKYTFKEVSTAKLPPGCSMCVDENLCDIASIVYNWFPSSRSLCGENGYDCFEQSNVAFVNARDDPVNEKIETLKDSISTGAQIRSYGRPDHAYSMGSKFKYKKSKYCAENEVEHENIYCMKYMHPYAISEEQCVDFVDQMNRKLGYNKYIYGGNFFSAGNFFNRSDSKRGFNQSLCSSGVYEERIEYRGNKKPWWSSGSVAPALFHADKEKTNGEKWTLMNSGKPDLWLDETMCREWAESNEESRYPNVPQTEEDQGFVGNWGTIPQGCVSAIADGKTVYNKTSNDIDCGSDGYYCVLGSDKWIEAKVEKCKEYATDHGFTFEDGGNYSDDVLLNSPQGCVKDDSIVWFNYHPSEKKCGHEGKECIKTLARIAPDKSVGKQQCKDYANNMGYTWGGDSDDGNTPGCFVQHSLSIVYYNEKTNNTKCGDIKASYCVQQFNDTLSTIQHDYLDANGLPQSICELKCPQGELFNPTERTCKDAFEFSSGAPVAPLEPGYVNQAQCEKYGVDKGYDDNNGENIYNFKDRGIPTGCVVVDSNIYYNTVKSEYECGDVAACVQSNPEVDR